MNCRNCEYFEHQLCDIDEYNYCNLKKQCLLIFEIDDGCKDFEEKRADFSAHKD